ncbi:MAG: internalization-related competence protein ComEC/Rec2, partial [Paucimonas sp.]|nr:internalization-related competence protein ComEC/Rec2 [Paucimonas sp.]
MRAGIIGFVAGAALLQTQAALPGWVLIAVLFVASSVAFLLRRTAVLPKSLWLVIGGALAGFSWAATVAQVSLAENLPTEWEGRDIVITGTVDRLPHRFEQGVRFTFTVEDARQTDGTKAPVPSRLMLSWYRQRYDAAESTPALLPGERWRLKVRLQRPHGNANPHGFDYEAWLLEQGVRATGYVRVDDEANALNTRLDDLVPGPRHFVERGRAFVRDRIAATLEGKRYAPVVIALVIGDQRAIDQADWKTFRITGVSHLMSISGLHITMVAGLFAALTSFLWRRSFFTSLQLPLILPAQKAAALAGAVAALAYVALAGFGIPAQRTLYMLSIVALALWSNRLASISHVLCLALGLVVLFDPWAVLAPGFWLSFGAVALLLYASVGRVDAAGGATAQRKWTDKLKAAGVAQYTVTLGLIPFTLLLFGQISIAGPVANAVAIPIVSLLVTPLALLGSVMPLPLSDWLLSLAHALLEGLMVLLDSLAAMPVSYWKAAVPEPWMFALALAGILWMLAPRGWPVRYLGLCAFLPMIFNAPSYPARGTMQVTAFDVGQGMALLIETERHRLLYDTGPTYSLESDGGKRVLIPYLQARGIFSLDKLVVSHQDSDHSGGALSVMAEIDIAEVASSLADEHPIAQRSRRHIRCMAGQQWEWDGVSFEMLHPAASSYASSKWKPNARSCTLRIDNGRRSLLLAGDIEAVQEAELVEGMPQKLQADVLLAPHHGSGTSSTPRFLAAVKPRMALF